MELNIKICTSNSCKIIVEDKTEIGGNGYLSESSNVVSKNQFKYSDTYSIITIRHNRLLNPENKSISILKHENNRKSKLDINFDGWFTVRYIVIPSIEWFNNNQNNLSIYTTVYYTDGLTLFKKNLVGVSTVDIEEILLVNTDGTTISKIEKDYFSVCNLQKCYVNHCKILFNGRLNLNSNKSKMNRGGCFSNPTPDLQLTFKRDVVWSALNVIKYLVDFNQLSEALRIIEQIGGCNGLCDNLIYNNSSYQSISGCGCNK